jgi:hypothetical protein
VELVGSYSNRSPKPKSFHDLLVLTTKRAARPPSNRPRMVQNRLDQPQLVQLKVDYLAGASIKELALKYQIHRATVHDHIHRMGLKRQLDRVKLYDPRRI